MFRRLITIFGAAGSLVAAPAAAQVEQVDPNQVGEYQPMTDPYATPEAVPSDPQAVQGSNDYVPIAPQGNVAVQAAPPAPDAGVAVQTAPVTPPVDTVPREDVFSAAESVFGRGAAGLGGLIERILKDQGQPIAYIAGQEAGGAFIAGVRYGSGTMRHQIEGDRAVYWTGPTVGFDFGAGASKVFVLVYNLDRTKDLFRAYPAAEGHAYALGGFTASFLRRGNVVLIPVRLGVGLRLGVNAGYMRFSEKNRWLPF